MGFWFTGGFMAVQGLWASRWMAVLEGMDSAAIALRLTWISGAMLGGFLFMGFFASKLVHRGIKLDKIYLNAMITAIAVSYTHLDVYKRQVVGICLKFACLMAKSSHHGKNFTFHRRHPATP